MLGTCSSKYDGMSACYREKSRWVLDCSKWRKDENCGKERGWQEERSWKRKEGIEMEVRDLRRKLLTNDF